MTASESDLAPQPPLRGEEGEPSSTLATHSAAMQGEGGVARVWRAIRFGWLVSLDALRDFVWADLREGVLDLRGLGAPLRALVWLGFGLLLLVIVGILQGDLWRQAFPLVPLTQGIPGRGRLVPISVIPVTFFLLSLAWSFILAGALRSHSAIRLAVVGLWALTMTGSMVSGGTSGMLSYAVAIATLLAVPIAFVIFQFRPPRRVFELLVLLALVTANNAVNQMQGVNTWQTSGMPLMVLRISFEVASLSLMIVPLLLLVGMDVAAFTAKAAYLVTGIAEQRMARWATWGLLAALLAWRFSEVYEDLTGWFDTGPLDTQLLALGGGLLVPLLVGLAVLGVWWLSPPGVSLPDHDEIESVSKRWAFPMVMSYTVAAVVTVVLSGVALAVTVLGLFVRSAVPLQDGLLYVMGVVGSSESQLLWHIVISLIAVGAACLLARRGQVAGALFLAILGLLDLKSRLASDGWPLAFTNDGGPGNRTDVWWLVAILGLAAYWLARRQLTLQRASVLAFITLSMVLLRQTDFISNRFSPFVDSSGLGFLAFGIIWDALTIGAWANVGSTKLPRVSRIFLYLGYILMTVTVINWAVASHDLAAVGQLTGGLGLVGLNAFGRPLLYTLFVIALAGAFRGEGITAIDDDLASKTEPAHAH